jgi:hypothetical protein
MCTSVHDLKNQLHFLGISDVDKMFSLFDGIGEASSSGIRNPYNSREKLACVPNFLFLMRSLMIRHSMHQKCREGRSIMVLPEKVRATWSLYSTYACFNSIRTVIFLIDCLLLSNIALAHFA